MPYIVTTKLHDEERSDEMLGYVVVSRHAVATLEEAQRTARNAVLDHADFVPDEAWGALICAAEDLPESGGTISLPDGTVIEVEQA